MTVIVQSPTPNIDLSKQFYEKLDFTIAKTQNGFKALAKNLIIEVNSDRLARAGLKLIGTNWDDFLTQNDLQAKASKTSTGHLLTSPAGCCVYLEESTQTGEKVATVQKPILGTFAGLSLETNQILESISFLGEIWFQTNGRKYRSRLGFNH